MMLDVINDGQARSSVGSSHSEAVLNHSSRDEETGERSSVSTVDWKLWASCKWCQVIFAATVTVIIVLCINLVFAIIAAKKLQLSDGFGVLYKGDCGKVKRWNSGLHVGINVLSSLLLMASNFTMQCLSSPTRSDIDKAHRHRISLDIGIPTVKNLLYVNPLRKWLWLALALSSVPLHLLYNSFILSSLGTYRANYLVVDESFFDIKRYKEPTIYPGRKCSDLASKIISQSRASYLDGNYSLLLTPAECLNAYSTPYLTDRRDFIAITHPQNGTRMSSGCAFGPKHSFQYLDGSKIIEFWDQPLWNGSSILGLSAATGSSPFTDINSLDWRCNGYESHLDQQALKMESDTSCDHDATAFNSRGSFSQWELQPFVLGAGRDSYGPPQAYEITGCVSEIKVPQICQLNYVAPILYVIITCNMIKAVCMGLTLRMFWVEKQPIVATVGDAVLSFLQQTDRTTSDYCLMSRRGLHQWKKSEQGGRALAKTQQFKRKLRFIQSSASFWKWFTTISMCVAYLAAGVALVRAGLQQSGFHSLTPGRIQSSGLGVVDPRTMFHHGKGVAAIASNTLLANFFQLALSISYFFYNCTFTAQCAALEWASYGIGKLKPLRVSFPKGGQRSTYYLQLPYRYGVPLLGVSILMHFLISQSIFLVLIVWHENDTPLNTENASSDQIEIAIGFSFLGLIVSICVGSFLILFLVLHTFRRFKTDIPMHGNNSAIISATCHTHRSNLDSSLEESN